ncbi:MAG TPA: CHRD domain-containing protein [Nitrososphaeraceae archaeon]|nr:CHRD domain-containing protein [Nitrososphaeraceae archaeon]
MIYSIPGGLAIWTLVLMSNFAFAQIDFRTDLAGEHVVPPIFSESYGSALIGGNDDNLKYQINVTSLDKVTGVFLHKGDSTENGQILVSLLNSTEPSGVIDGNLIEGTINSSSIMLPLANLTTNILAVPAYANLTNATAATVGNLTNATAATVGNLTNATTSVNPPSKLEALIDLMGQNMTYINILTSDFPQGELRGTLTSTNSTG